MYIIELFFKLKEKFKTRKTPAAPAFIQEEDTADENCEHIFAPVDSTNTVLACVKCGFLIHCNPNDLKKKNIFEREDFKQL